jgi:hypothetical protein
MSGGCRWVGASWSPAPPTAARPSRSLADGLPGANAWDLVYRHGLDVDESGERLAIGSTTGGLWLSENGGNSWRSVPARLPPITQVLFLH